MALITFPLRSTWTSTLTSIFWVTSQPDILGLGRLPLARLDPYALLDVLTTIDSIDPASNEVAVLMKTHPPTPKRLDKLSRKMDGRLDDFSAGRHNADRFRQVAAGPR